MITAHYSIESEKISSDLSGYRIAMLADLHNCTLGTDNSSLVSALKKEKPDCILVAGDMVVESAKCRRIRVEFDKAEKLLYQLMEIAPVYYENGNHESRWKKRPSVHPAKYRDYQRRLQKAGVIFLQNSSVLLDTGRGRIRITGLELPLRYFERIWIPKLSAGQLHMWLGNADREYFQILLAHSPQFFKTYAAWGADLTLAGHFHGGLVRLPLLGGMISTYYRPFPKYDYGLFRRNGRSMVVSSGLGFHTLPLRINNPVELVILNLKSRPPSISINKG